jgi:hypothetical protein
MRSLLQTNAKNSKINLHNHKSESLLQFGSSAERSGEFSIVRKCWGQRSTATGVSSQVRKAGGVQYGSTEKAATNGVSNSSLRVAYPNEAGAEAHFNGNFLGIVYLIPFPVLMNASWRILAGLAGFTLLQEARFAAWEPLKAYRTGNNLPHYRYLRSIRELARIPARWGKYSEQGLLSLCARGICSRREPPAVDRAAFTSQCIQVRLRECLTRNSNPHWR